MRLLGYAAGNYYGQCKECGKEFQGDKRAHTCLNCATQTANLMITNLKEALSQHCKYKSDNCDINCKYKKDCTVAIIRAYTKIWKNK